MRTVLLDNPPSVRHPWPIPSPAYKRRIENANLRTAFGRRACHPAAQVWSVSIVGAEDPVHHTGHLSRIASEGSARSCAPECLTLASFPEVSPARQTANLEIMAVFTFADLRPRVCLAPPSERTQHDRRKAESRGLGDRIIRDVDDVCVSAIVNRANSVGLYS